MDTEADQVGEMDIVKKTNYTRKILLFLCIFLIFAGVLVGSTKIWSSRNDPNKKIQVAQNMSCGNENFSPKADTVPFNANALPKKLYFLITSDSSKSKELILLYDVNNTVINSLYSVEVATHSIFDFKVSSDKNVVCFCVYDKKEIFFDIWKINRDQTSEQAIKLVSNVENCEMIITPENDALLYLNDYNNLSKISFDTSSLNDQFITLPVHEYFYSNIQIVWEPQKIFFLKDSEIYMKDGCSNSELELKVNLNNSAGVETFSISPDGLLLCVISDRFHVYNLVYDSGLANNGIDIKNIYSRNIVNAGFDSSREVVYFVDKHIDHTSEGHLLVDIISVEDFKNETPTAEKIKVPVSVKSIDLA